MNLMKFLDNLNEPYEIMIGDNGSTDSTFKKGKKLVEKYPNKINFFNLEKIF